MHLKDPYKKESSGLSLFFSLFDFDTFQVRFRVYNKIPQCIMEQILIHNLKMQGR